MNGDTGTRGIGSIEELGVYFVHRGEVGHIHKINRRFHNVRGCCFNGVEKGLDVFQRLLGLGFHAAFGELSGGQKKRVFLARAIAQQGDVILLDEPFTGVDVKTEAKIISLLRELRAEGKTMLVSTHNLGSVTTFCDYTVMVKGTVLASGPTDTTFTAENLELAFSGVLRHVTLNGSEESIITDDEHPFVAHRPSAVQGEAR